MSSQLSVLRGVLTVRILSCEKCGGSEFRDNNGFRICQYCNAKYVLAPEETPRKTSVISLRDDINALLQKCRDDPSNSFRYARLVQDLEPGNAEAERYLHPCPQKKKGR